MPVANLFISAVCAEFESYRAALRRDLTRTDLSVAVQEDFVASGTETLDKLDDYLRSCDGVVHLVGEMTGAGAQPPSVAVLAAALRWFGAHAGWLLIADNVDSDAAATALEARLAPLAGGHVLT